MSGPNSNPAVSDQQSYRTPPDFLAAVERRFDALFAFDLAATRTNAVAAGYFDHSAGDDALARTWPTIVDGDAAWLNPPFNRAKDFARKASESPQCRTLMLVPASVGTAWFAEYVHGRALVVFLRPRLVFLNADGTPMPAGINRDLMLCAYGWTPGVYTCQDWREW